MDRRPQVLAAIDAAADSARALASMDERYNTRNLVEGGARAFDAQVSHAFDRFVDDVRALQRACAGGLDAAVRLDVFEQRHGSLRRIERALAMRVADLPRLARHGLSDERRRRLRSLYDTTLGKCLAYTESMRALNESVTRSFNALCRGITTFRGDDTPSQGPIYHRSKSCGPRERDKASHMDCVTAHASDRARRAEHARNCYVERLLYNDLYEAMLGRGQDMPHRYELRTVERLFQECFPGKAVVTALSFAGDVTTVHVTTLSNGAAESVETYNTMGDGRVACDWVEYDPATGGVIREASKVQSFDGGPTAWQPA